MFLPTEKELTNITESKMLAFHGTSSRLKFVIILIIIEPIIIILDKLYTNDSEINERLFQGNNRNRE